MDNIINLLPDHIANQIAAGEVIQRPASVIKELVENSVDAGADNIIIEIKDAGKTLIQVIDNGKGMDPIDARMAFERHATSKIRDANDLFALKTMGFRGEALASIAAVSHITLRTRTADNPVGSFIELEASKITTAEPAVCPIGANFAVRNLFFNVPARRKFLKADETEFRHITTEVQKIATVNPQIAFTLKHNDNLNFHLDTSTLKERIINIYGKRFVQILLPLDTDTPLVHVHGFVGRASAGRKRGAQQFFYVNERFMKHTYFHRMVMNAYEGMMAPGEQPEYFLFLEVAPDTIDVNIHPTKTEIKFESEKDIGRIIYSTVREALMKGASVPSIDFNADNALEIPHFKPMADQEMKEPPIYSHRSSSSRPPIAPPTNVKDLTMDSPLPEEYALPDMSDWDDFYATFQPMRKSSGAEEAQYETVRSTLNFSAEEGERLEGKEGMTLRSSALNNLPRVEDIILLDDNYSLYKYDGAFNILHQGRAKLRIFYEEYLSHLNREHVVGNRLIFPQLIEPGIKEEQLLTKEMPRLQRLGFDISDMGNHSYSINAVPSGIAAGAEEELLYALLNESAALEKSSEEIIMEKLVLSLAKHRLHVEGSAVSSKEEVENLLAQLLTLGKDYMMTPEGKVIVSIINHKEIDKRFN